MKRLYIQLLLVFSLSAISSCDYLNIVPDDVATIDHAFTDRYNAEKFLFTCYSYLPKMGSINSNPALMGSDELSMGVYHQNHRGVELSNGFQNINNPLFDYWRGTEGGMSMYTGIRDCNIFLERIDDVQDLSEYEKEIWKGEVKFIKAYLHFYLIKMYGPIHLIRDNISINESLEKVKTTRDSLDECFEYVIELLDESIGVLPENVQAEVIDLGHVTSTIALALKAKVLVTAASPLFNGERGVQISNPDGSSLFPSGDQSVIKDKWEKAAEACRLAVEMALQNGYGLFSLDDFRESGNVSDTTKLKSILRYRVTERENREVIWTNTNSPVGGIQSEVMPPYFSVVNWRSEGQVGVPLKISELYYTNNGVPIDEDKDWQSVKLNEIKTVEDDHLYYLKLGYKTVNRNLNREARFYSDLLFDGSLVYGHARTYKNDINSQLDYINHKQGGHSTAGYARKFNPFGYWPAKLVNIDTGQDDLGFRITNYGFPTMRLADLYLLYAEALINIDDLAGAKIWIDKIRERSGLKPVEQAWKDHSNHPDKPNSKSGLYEILKQERLIELAFEGSRFWDLRRWLDAEAECNKPVRGWDPLKETAEGYYVPQTIYEPSFTIRDYFFPIAENELIKNPNLVQNYGW